MFQYTKENILNVTTNPFEVVTDNGVKKLVIKGYGEYVIDNIVDKKVYKTVGTEGVTASKTFTVAAPADGVESILSFRVVTSKALGEFASPAWQVFGKPIVVGFNKDTDLQKAIELAIPEGNKLFSVSVSGRAVTLTASTKYMDFDKIAVDDKLVALTTDVKNVEPFATKEWIIENLRFPTYSNIRYNSASVMPTADLYTEYAFTYRVPRVGLGGLSGVGQAIDAVTRHIFYVPKDVDVTFADLAVDAIADEDDLMVDTPLVDTKPADDAE